jgi:tetratricopeptide (TPR) repeat protein
VLFHPNSAATIINILIWAFAAMLFAVGLCYGQSTEKLYDQGVEYGAQGKIEEARGAFEKALTVDPFNSSAAAGLEIVKDAIGGKIK